MQTPCYSPIPASAYYDNKYLVHELERIFKKSWLLIGVTLELSKPGDYFARDALGIPIIIWNDEGDFKAYINVCPHRHAMLLDNGAVGSSEILTCPYHGWQFNAKGNVCKIPDAECFKGLKKEGAHALRSIRVERLEHLLFIQISENNSQSLEDFMGADVYSGIKQLSKRSSRLISSRYIDLPCNWKLMYENGTEDYHTPLIHKETFGNNLMLKDANIIYEKTDNHQGCKMSAHVFDEVKKFNINSPIATISLFSGLHVTVGNQSVKVCTFEQELPISATTSQRRLWLMCNKRLDESIIEIIKRDVLKIQLEDEALMANNQRGKENAFSPQLLGHYETRIAYFHDYLINKINYKANE